MKREKIEKILVESIELYRDILEIMGLKESDRKRLSKQIGIFKKQLFSTFHTEILEIILNETFIANPNTLITMGYIMTLFTNPKAVKLWDDNQEEFSKFKSTIEEQHQIQRQKQEEAIKYHEAIKKATAEGKKVEIVVEDGKPKPVVIEEN